MGFIMCKTLMRATAGVSPEEKEEEEEGRRRWQGFAEKEEG